MTCRSHFVWILLVFACSNDSTRPPDPAVNAPSAVVAADAPPAPGWITPKEARLSWDGHLFQLPETSLHGSVSSKELDYLVEVSFLPVGATVEVGEVRQSNRDVNGRIELVVPNHVAVGQLPRKQAFQYGGTDVTAPGSLRITFPDGGSVTSELPAVRLGNVEPLLTRWASRGVKLEADPQATKPRRATLFGQSRALKLDKVIGNAAKVVDIGRVVAIEPTRGGPSGKTCKEAYGKREYPLHLEAWEVRVHDRVTGELVSKKSFPADGTCPVLTEGDVAYSVPDDASIRRWIQSLP